MPGWNSFPAHAFIARKGGIFLGLAGAHGLHGRGHLLGEPVMLRANIHLTPYYQVVLSPDAWVGVGCVSADDFLVIQGVMDLLAAEGTPYEQGVGPHLVTVSGFEVEYTRDDVARTLTLLRVTRVLTGSGEAA